MSFKADFENKKLHIWFRSISRYMSLAFLYMSFKKAEKNMAIEKVFQH